MEKDIWECLPDFADLLLDAVFVVDAQGRIVYVSAACEGIFGYTPAEMTGRPRESQISVRSASNKASSTSTPRYRTVFSILE